MAANSPLLQIENCTIKFGGLTAVSELNLELRERELVGLIGPNGAGKTTVFNVVTGVYAPTSGAVRFASENISGMQPHQIARRGIARTFQNIRLFPSLTVLDNVRVSFQLHLQRGFRRALWRGAKFYDAERMIEQQVVELLDIFNLGRFRYSMARGLPYGDQRRLEIVRALATRPRLLLLDEPAAGMNTREKSDLMALIRQLRDQFSLGILVIEHDMKLVMGICEEITVLDHGETIAVGSPEQVRKNRKVVEAYLGDSYLEAQTTVAAKNLQ